MDDIQAKLNEMTSQQILEALRKKEGAEFDAAFLDHMIAHHQSGVEMARLAVERAASSELQDMAKEMVKNQGKEIEAMQEMRPISG